MAKKKEKKKINKKKNYIIDFFNEALRLDLALIGSMMDSNTTRIDEFMDDLLNKINDMKSEDNIYKLKTKIYLKEITYIFGSLRNDISVESLLKAKSTVKQLTKKFIEINKTSYIRLQLELSDLMKESDMNEGGPAIFAITSIAKDIVALICVEKNIIENRKIKTIYRKNEDEYIIEYFNEIGFTEGDIRQGIKEIQDDIGYMKKAEISNKYTLLKEYFLENKYVINLLKECNTDDSYMIELKNDPFEGKFKKELIKSIYDERRYIYPEEGVMIEFKKDSDIESIEIYEDRYYFFTKYNIKNNGDNIYRVKNIEMEYDEFNITGMILDIEEKPIEKLTNTLIWRYSKDDIAGINYYNANVFVTTTDTSDIDKFFYIGVTAIYTALCNNKYLDGINIGRVKRSGSNSQFREDGYRIAHIRRLPNGMKASQEAKRLAKENNIKLPNQYTFVKEHNEEAAKQKIIKVKGELMQ